MELGLLAKDTKCPPYLLVVGAVNSRDHGPAWLKEEAEREALRRRRPYRRRDRAAAADIGAIRHDPV